MATDGTGWFVCEWGDGCDQLVHVDEEGAPLCWSHHGAMLEEDAADVARKMIKENEMERIES